MDTCNNTILLRRNFAFQRTNTTTCVFLRILAFFLAKFTTSYVDLTRIRVNVSILITSVREKTNDFRRYDQDMHEYVIITESVRLALR